MDIALLTLGERNRLRGQILQLQQIFDQRQRQQDFLAGDIANYKAQLAALDTQITTFPTAVNAAVTVAIANDVALGVVPSA
jgi:hypothetical protein